MKKIVCALLLAASLTGCSAPTLTASNGKTYSDYGILNQQENFDPKVKYEPNWGNIFLGVVFFEMVIPPVFVFGFHLMEPVGLK